MTTRSCAYVWFSGASIAGRRGSRWHRREGSRSEVGHGVMSLTTMCSRATPATTTTTTTATTTTPSLVTWNVASLRSLLRKDHHALDRLVSEHAPLAICLQETKLQESHVADHVEAIDGYRSFWSCSTARKGYSGTAIFVRDDVQVQSVTYGIGQPDADLEGRTITLDLYNCSLVTLYTPNAGEGLKRLDYRTAEFETALREYTRKLARTKPLILCGDLNVAHEAIDLHNPDGHRRSAGFTDEERDCFRQLIADGQLVDSFRALYPDLTERYTYWSYRGRARERNRGWRIDYFLVSPDLQPSVLDCALLDDVFGSDHCPVLLQLRDSSLFKTSTPPSS